MKKLCIVGAGPCARETFCVLSDLGLENDFYAFFQSDKDYKAHTIYDWDVLPLSKFNPDLHKAVIAVAEPATREKIVNEMPANTEYYSLIHPSVLISKNVEIKEGAIIFAGSILTCDIKMGKHAILNVVTTIGHDCIIGDYFTSTPGVHITGRCKIGNRVYIGTNTSFRGYNVICDDVVIGMGSVVLKNIDSPGIYMGNPLKSMWIAESKQTDK